jgi:molybdopterin-guanine dinucleotide biosynthesis protein A
MMGAAAGVILAGGSNRRFPALKSFIQIEGTPIIGGTLAILSGLFPLVMISTNMPEAYFHLGVPLIGDVLPSRGPMSGIYSALLNAGGDVFVLACDMPLVNADVVALVCSEHEGARETTSPDATVPVCHGEPQPLFGVYSLSALPFLEEAIGGEKTTMKRFLGEIRTHFVEEKKVRAKDPLGRSFLNINTPEDLEEIIQTLQRDKG